jgi:hypothetical protein
MSYQCSILSFTHSAISERLMASVPPHSTRPCQTVRYHGLRSTASALVGVNGVPEAASPFLCRRVTRSCSRRGDAELRG